MSTVNSFGARTPLAAGGRSVQIYSLPTLQEAGFPGIARLPYSMKILLENLLRHEDGRAVRAADANAFQLNAELEFARNRERYAFVRWGQDAFQNFRVVPPDTGIVHQVNLEYLARVVMIKDSADGPVAFPDTLVGTDSHTTMVNGLG